MQVVSTSSYNDIDICNPLDGSNLLLSNLKSFSVPFNVNSTPGGGSQGTFFNYTFDNNCTSYLYILNIKIQNNMLNNIKYYRLIDIIPSDDYTTLFPANQMNGEDNYTIVWLSRNRQHDGNNFNQITLRLSGFNSNNELIFGQSVSGTVEAFMLS